MPVEEALTWRSSPWLTIWFKPQQTIKRVTQTNDIGRVLFLGAAAGVVSCLSWSETSPLSGRGVLAIALVFGPILGLFQLVISSALYTWVGRRLGGKASFRQMRSAYAWSMVPMVLWLAVVIGVSLFYGPSFLAAMLSEQKDGDSLGKDIALAMIGLAATWSIVLLVRTCGAVQNFGVFRSLATLLAPTLVLVAIAFSVRSFVMQPFNIPSQAMTPTLLVGDHFFANKTCYGYSKFTSPLLPDFEGRIWRAAAPQRGDIVVFKLPKDNKTDYVKRIIGLPGDEILIKGGVVRINGTTVPRKQVADFIDDTGRYKQGITAFEETLPNGVRYTVLDLRRSGRFDDAGPFNVPAGHYFMMGDNRDNSVDSRAQQHVGYIPEENLLGCASVFYFSAAPLPKKESDNCWFCNIRFERFWKRVR